MSELKSIDDKFYIINKLPFFLYRIPVTSSPLSYLYTEDFLNHPIAAINK